MHEVRVAWNVIGHEDDGGQPIWHGQWMEATLENRRACKIIAECGCEVAGPGSHWVETREAPDALPQRRPA